MLTLDQEIKSCPFINYAVNSSTDCMTPCDCGFAKNDTVVTCTNVHIGSKCSIKIKTIMCGVLVNENNLTVNITSRSTSLTASCSTSSMDATSSTESTITTPSKTRKSKYEIVRFSIIQYQLQRCNVLPEFLVGGDSNRVLNSVYTSLHHKIDQAFPIFSCIR